MNFGTSTYQKLPRGWRFQDTPSHGYFYPSNEHNQNVPAFIRRNSYEEDCAYHIPVYFNPGLFTEEVWKNSEQSFKDWFPKEFEKATGKVLAKGESSLKDNYYFNRIENVGMIEATAAFGDWCFDVPKGFVYFYGIEIQPKDKSYKVGSPSGDQETFLITDEKYSGNRRTFNRYELIPYKRNEDYYTWEDYTKKTGNQRYSIEINLLTL